LLIEKTTIESASHSNTVLVGDDTDLLDLLCFHTPIDCSHEIHFRPGVKSGTHKLPRCWNIKLTKRVLGLSVCENILFGHASLGCDTTSRVFGIGKGVALKLLRSNENFIYRRKCLIEDLLHLKKLQLLEKRHCWIFILVARGQIY